jgi:hypothetical protein
MIPRSSKGNRPKAQPAVRVILGHYTTERAVVCPCNYLKSSPVLASQHYDPTALSTSIFRARRLLEEKNERVSVGIAAERTAQSA